jgi:predicted O-methyltransferase YrrM
VTEFNLESQLELLDEIVANFKSEYDALPLEADEGFRIFNNWMGPVDAEMLYSMVRRHHPHRLIEIGSGMSTMCIGLALRQNEAEQHPCRFTAIDPKPRHDVSSVAGLNFKQEKLEDIPLWMFQDLEQNDILFIDSSHIYQPGNDVDIEYSRILPALRSGVVVQIHDIFLPNGYPAWWSHRGYDEQSHVVQLLETGEWDVLWGSQFVHLNRPDRLRDAFRSYKSVDYPGSLWMRKH